MWGETPVKEEVVDFGERVAFSRRDVERIGVQG